MALEPIPYVSEDPVEAQSFSTFLDWIKKEFIKGVLEPTKFIEIFDWMSERSHMKIRKNLVGDILQKKEEPFVNLYDKTYLDEQESVHTDDLSVDLS